MLIHQRINDMNKILLLPMVVIVLFLSSCSLAPEYARPEAPVPAEWPQGAAYGSIRETPGPAAIPELRWEEFIPDQKLQTIIKTALDTNRDLRLAALNVEKVQALYGVQRASLFPSVEGAGGMSKERVPADLSATGESMIAEQYGVNLGITSWEIDFFGRIRRLEDQALEEFLATDQARRGAETALISSFSAAYLTLAADRGNLELARSTLDAQQAAYTLIQKRYDVGMATELDLRRAQTQVEAARGSVARYIRLTAQDRNALDLLAGAPVPEELLPASIDHVIPPEDISPGLSSEVLLSRPDIMAAEHRLKGAYAFIGAARAALFPRITLTTSVGTASAELSGLFGAGSATWSFVPRITMPIFDARSWAALRVSKAERKIALTQYEKAIQTAFKEVADALAVRGTIDQQVEAQQSLVDAVAEAYRLSNERYENGVDSYLSVLDAHRSLFSAKQGLISLRLAELVSRVTLYTVLGGGE